jgi:hypothetical protein
MVANTGVKEIEFDYIISSISLAWMNEDERLSYHDKMV